MRPAPASRTPRTDRRPAIAVVLCAIAMTTTVVAPPAQAVTVGANLNRPANVRYGCEVLPSTDAFGRRLLLGAPFGGAATCTYLGFGVLGALTETPQAPSGGGIVTQVRVKVGPVTGPMQITVLKALRTRLEPGAEGTGAVTACCFYDGATPAFTPAPNAVTTLNVRLLMRNDLDPAFGETVDYLGLTVLAPGVPIPAHDLGTPGDVRQPGALGFFPHIKPGDERSDYAGVGAFVPLISAEIIQLCGGRAARAAAGPCIPVVSPVGAATVANGRARLQLLCNLLGGCNGSVRLQSRAASGRTTVTFATGTIRLGPNATTTISARLTAAGRALLRSRRSARAYAVIRIGGRTVTRLVTVRR